MLGQKQDSADSEKSDHPESSSGGEIQIEVKSAFRKVCLFSSDWYALNQSGMTYTKSTRWKALQ